MGFLAGIAGVTATYEETETTIPSAVVDTTRLREIAPPCEVRWQDGFRRLAEHVLGSD